MGLKDFLQRNFAREPLSWNIGEALPEKIGDQYAVPGGVAQEVGITEEDMEQIKSDVEHILEVANGDPAIALVMIGYALEAAVSYLVREDIEGVLGFPIPDEEWPAMQQELSHYNEHVTVCHVPLAHRFVRDCWDTLHACDPDGIPELTRLREMLSNLGWRVTGG